MFRMVFYPFCVRPLYLLETKEQAFKCGYTVGIVYALIICFLFLVLGYKFLFKFFDEIHMKWLIIGLVIFFFIFPLMLGLSYKTMFQGYEELFQQLYKDGFDRYKAIQFIQTMESTASPPDYSPYYATQGLAMVVAKKKEEDNKNNK